MIGKLHPLLVHFPIGIFGLGAILFFIDYLKKETKFKESISTILLISFLSGILSCATGYFLSDEGGYEQSLIDKHMWSGITTTAFMGLFWYFYTYSHSLIWLVGLIGITLTGHWGGSLTHGEDFLTLTSKKENNPINPDQALVYQDVIKPILEEKCYSCHSSKKQKGNLNLETSENILKGGENGLCLKPGDAEGSLLVKRYKLPIGDEEHMPPKGKPQLTSNEMQIIQWWINQNASFNKKLTQIPGSEAIKALLITQKAVSILPEDEISKPSDKVLDELQKAGITVSFVGNNSNYVHVNALNFELKKEHIQRLDEIKNHIITFKHRNVRISNELVQLLANAKNLKELNLSGTSFDNKHLAILKNNPGIVSLNVSGTLLEDSSMPIFKEMKNLSRLYIFNSKIKNRMAFNQNLKNVKVDTGFYSVPTLRQDTVKIVFQ
ncbi:MAG: c-type cytochrome domain-containing protein [Leadbetterella sp.]